MKKNEVIKVDWLNNHITQQGPIVIAAMFFGIINIYYPFRERLQFDPDEGLNLMRSMLVYLQHPLYVEVSSDQPPLFTHLLALLFRFTGLEVNPARIIVLLFATLLVWSCSKMLQLTWGNISVLLFLPIIMMTPRFVRLSVSVMIGLPAIALASVSVLLILLWHKKEKDLWLVLSGFTLALSILIKFFTIFLAPILIFGILFSTYLKKRDQGWDWHIFRSALIWGISFGFLASAIGLTLIGFQNMSLVLTPHIIAENTTTFQDEFFSINSQIKESMPILLLGLFGLYYSIVKKKWLSYYFIAWVGAAYILLSLHRPVFYHHQLLITIPVAMLAAGGIAEGLFSIIRIKKAVEFIRIQPIMGLVTVLCFIQVMINYFPPADESSIGKIGINGFPIIATPGKIQIITDMNNYIGQTNWILTDSPMYAFLLKRPVPPILATFSLKRLETGSLLPEEIINAARIYNPEQVLLGRFNIPVLDEYLKNSYTLIASPEVFRLFIRNDLLETK